MARQPKTIDWNQVKLRIQAGNSAAAISDWFEIAVSTFYRRFEEQFGINFENYKREVCSGLGYRKDNIEYTQYVKALSGNTTLLIHLGEEWCEQKAGNKDAKPPNDLLIGDALTNIKSVDLNGIEQQANPEHTASESSP